MSIGKVDRSHFIRDAFLSASRGKNNYGKNTVIIALLLHKTTVTKLLLQN